MITIPENTVTQVSGERAATNMYNNYRSSTPQVGTGNVSRSNHTLDLSITSAYNNFSNHPRYLGNVSAPEYAGSGALSQNGGNASYERSGRESRFKKAPLPTFNGDRKEWAEFRAVWLPYAYSELSTEEDRAWNLKQCLRGRALTHIKAILINQPQAHERMWKRLEDIYSDASVAVRGVCADLEKLKPVAEGDVKGLMEFVNTVEMCYSQLGEVQQLMSVTLAQVDSLKDRLPPIVRRDWMRLYRSLTPEQKIHPFTSFMQFLEEERDICIRENSQDPIKQQKTFKDKEDKRTFTKTHVSDAKPELSWNEQPTCLLHPNSKTKHTTVQCNLFKKMTRKDRVALLIKNKSCFKCGGKHMRHDCSDNSTCEICGHSSHHTLLCREEHAQPQPDNVSVKPTQTTEVSKTEKSTSHANQSSSCSVFPIQKVLVAGTSCKATVFFDGGSNATYVSTDAAKRWKAKKVGTAILEVTKVGNITSEYRTHRYKINLITSEGKAVPIIAYGMKEITSPISSLGIDVLHSLFPHRVDVSDLVREEGPVDILLGNDYYGHHPKVEIDRAGPHLSLMEGDFGCCLQGYHTNLQQLPVVSNLIGSICIEGESVTQSVVQTNLTKADLTTIESFIRCEDMVTEVQPRCGSCKCGKCPIKGHTYSFKEQQELEMIRNNLEYDKEKGVWVTKYPWLLEPNLLPSNYKAVLATLKNTEKTLQKRGSQWSETYANQIKDMENRSVARKLTADELKSWRGPTFYISHLAVENPKSSSTPVRIVFNSSQKFNGMSLNDALAKGPDNYITSLLGIIMRWREGPAVLIGDIRKMFNSIYIDEMEQHCHRFLWRDMELNREPDTYVITRVNMGDRPAPAISSEAVLKTAEMMKQEFPRVATLFNESMYVDDIVESVSSGSEARQLAEDATTVLNKGGFQIKGWVFNDELNTSDMSMHVLGILWNPSSDKIQYNPLLNFSNKKRSKHTEPDLLVDQIPQEIPVVLTKRMVLEQVMRLYDPLGILSPFIVRGKIYLRETWDLGLAWDDPLPAHMRNKWVTFFIQMCQLSAMEYDRCLTPRDAQGQPTLVILSDASDKAYGFAAYIRWKLSDGKYFCRLVLAKSRIAPIRKLSTPQLELNGAVLAKRGREVIEKEMRFQFDKIMHLTDSETILCMLQKTSTRFRLYEGVRIGEIQSASKDMSEWNWIRGENNTADWVTRGRSPEEIGPESSWWRGPEFLYLDETQWNTKTIKDLRQHQELLPGEKKPVNTNHATVTQKSQLIPDYSRFSSAKKLIWVVARLLAIKESKSFKAGRTCNVTVQHIENSKKLLIREAQAAIQTELDQGTRGKYARLKAVKDAEGFWIIGERMLLHNPLKKVPEDPPLKLLPNNHPFTRLLMEEAHKLGGHRGRDATLARFRHSFWTTQGAKLAKAVKNGCQLCKVRQPQTLTQEMGSLPLGRLQPSAPFSNVVIDMFGPFPVRGEVQKRTTGKAWGVIFTDMASRAVHIEAVFGYDTASFLLALRRFTGVRGWPATIYSDPGSQLTHAEKELKKIWDSIDKELIYKTSTDNGLQWIFGPADSPWYQGAAESLIKSAKKGLAFCMSGQRFSPAEFLTICTEVANMMNERPLGRIPSEDSAINLLTPNSLLLGRSLSNSIGDAGAPVVPIKSRVDLVSNICQRFWEKWIELFAPTMIPQTKWHGKARNLQVGDIVLVKDSNMLRSQYHVAEVLETYPDAKGTVRTVSLRYRNVKIGDKMKEYKGGHDVVITRSVHKLALIVPIEDQ
jgi:hypothetical protein